ncbi:MAG: asparagine synthase (glutamine-hydrolyzing) [Nitrosomonadaceae bacterium]|nr:asparagine synthase (glutamine-hydrolyzing) [Nitrosomonadaceae bacterium]|tara:strand:+ start:1194 stop:3122 length:1929 start_codon:yes stop_codon:yes gene_type:complete
MCGFVGFLGEVPSEGQKSTESLLKRMADSITYRGPDDEGYWCDVDNRIALGHRRLSVLDLSSAGHQPMISPSGRYVIAFNGEVYNHMTLRQELRVASWRGHSDTETLLTGFDEWGIQEAIERVVGMFAFAVWDNTEQTLILGRDRIGEKPLYYGWQDDNFLFGSELKALKMHPAFKAEINRDSVCLFMRHSYVPAPYSIYTGIRKLEPGCLLSCSLTQPEPTTWKYWSAVNSIKKGIDSPFSGTPVEAVDELERLTKDSIKQQMVADVPLGAFLSGGKDSSTVVALMQSQSSQKIKTFSIGFDEDGYNEAIYAKAVAQHLGTDHTELYVPSNIAREVIASLPSLYDEPFSDSSQIPTFLVAQLAKQHVTVALSGDAGDELFGGYNRYKMTGDMWRKLSLFPRSLRKLAAQGIEVIPPQAWNKLSEYIPGMSRFVNIGDKLHKGAGVMTSRSIDELYLRLVSFFSNPESLIISGREPDTLLTGNMPDFTGLDNVQRMMALDLVTYLPDDILVKVDRAAMGVSLETRVPFLDHRIVEFAWTLPQTLKIRDGETKWPLCQILYRYVPRELIDRPKMGFGIPIHDWLRGPLKDWAEALLNESRLKAEGIFYPEPIRVLWKEHLSGHRNLGHYLWNVLMFQLWLEQQ